MKAGPKGLPAVLTAVFLFCLAFHWLSFTAWFRGDDFAWMGLYARIHSFRDLAGALFAPAAQGTVRPWSERAFFLAGFGLFGMHALPFRIAIFATEFANLALMMAVARRLTGSLAAAVCGALFWITAESSVEPLGWACVYNQVLCGFFLLLAFYCLLRKAEALAGGDRMAARRWETAEWLAFLFGFGAQELNIVYPALAAAFVLAFARPLLGRILPMFAVSALYAVLHRVVAPPERFGPYAMHFTGSVLRSLGVYWGWALGRINPELPFAPPFWLVAFEIALVAVVLSAFAAWRLKHRDFLPLVCIAWFIATIGPVLPLRDHRMVYYLYLPMIGLSWLAGWGLATAWRARRAHRGVAVALALLYAAIAIPQTLFSSSWNYRLTIRTRDLVEGVAGAHERHPAAAILLDGVDTDLFYNAVLDHPFRALGIEKVYLAPGSERTIESHTDWGDAGEFVLPGPQVSHALGAGRLVVYDARRSLLRNITSEYARRLVVSELPRVVDAGDPMSAWLLGPEWYPIDGNHRWMPARATLRIAAPAARGAQLRLHGYCPDEQLRAGPLRVDVMVNGKRLPSARIEPGGNAFHLVFALPDPAPGATEMRVTIEVPRTFRAPSDVRDLGLAFGTIEVP